MKPQTIRKLKNAALIVAAVIGVVLMWSGLSLMEQSPAADVSLYPYIARAFAGLALLGAAVTAQNAGAQKSGRR